MAAPEIHAIVASRGRSISTAARLSSGEGNAKTRGQSAPATTKVDTGPAAGSAMGDAPFKRLPLHLTVGGQGILLPARGLGPDLCRWAACECVSSSPAPAGTASSAATLTGCRPGMGPAAQGPSPGSRCVSSERGYSAGVDAAQASAGRTPPAAIG